ncbi:MAG: tetratricopeptide repeat protein [Pirellulales bacterium]|nr:tetratricopeptide repeat protein [Pirellulales bacterium]
MRTLNIRFALILLVASVVLGVGTYFLHGYQITENASMFLSQADRLEQQAEEAAAKGNIKAEQEALKDATRALGWYVRLMPNVVEVRERLGMMLADRAMDENADNRSLLFRQAFGLLEDTVAMDPKRTDARRQLVKMAMMIPRYQDAKEHLQGFLLKDSPNDPELLEQLGQCQMRMGDADAALKSFRKAIEHGPDQVAAYMALASLLRSRFSQPEEADQLMKQLVDVNPKSSQAHYLRAGYLHMTERHDEALEEVSKALELAPDDLNILRLASTCNLIKGNIDEARRCANRGIELRPKAAAMYTMLADIETRAENYDEALAALERGLKATARDPQILWGIANLLIDIEKLDEARETIEQLSAGGDYPPPMIDYLKARIEYSQGHWRKAIDGFEGVRGSLVTMAGLVRKIDEYIGHCYGRLGNREKQEEAIQRILNADPTNPRALAEMANLNYASGQYDHALTRFRQLVDTGRAAPASALMLARMLYMQNMRRPPHGRDWKPVEDALKAAEKALPDSPEVVIMRANVLLGQDSVEEAEELLRAARDKDPKQPAFWSVLTSLADRRGDWEEAEKILREADEALGDTAERRVARARHLVLRYGKEATERLRKLSENTGDFSEEQLVQLWGGLLSAAMQVDDVERINSYSRMIAEKQPDNVNIRYLIFERALRTADRPAMEESLKEVERVAGKGSVWLYGQAVLLFLDNKDEKDESKKNAALRQALGLLEQARELRGDWSRIPLVEGGIYEALGRPEEALDRYRTAFDMGERNPNGIRRIVQLLMQTRQYAEADMLIRQLEREQPQLSPDLNQVGAELALRQAEYDRALELARKAVAAESENYLEHLWLGQILRVIGIRAKTMNQEENAAELLGDAEKALRRAVELEPKLPQTWVALVRFFSIVGEVDKAEKAYEQAKLSVSAEEAPRALASIVEAMNKIEEAEKLYEAALEAAPEDIQVVREVAEFYLRHGKMQSAEALLQRIIEGKAPGETSDLVWARRQLAMIYATRRGYENLQKARELLEQNLAESGDSAIDRRVLADVYGADPQRFERDHAIAQLEKLLDDPEATPEDQLKLAIMYDSAGEWIKASNLYRPLVAGYPRETRYLVAYIEALLRHKEFSSVEMYLDRLTELAPKWFVTYALRSDLLCAKNQPDKALELIRQFVDEADEQSKDRDARLRLGANKLAQLANVMTEPERKQVAEKFRDQAETWLRAFAKEQPPRNLLLSMFLGTRGKIDEALALLEQSLDHSTPQDFSRVATSVSHYIKADQRQFQRLDGILQKGLDKFERHPALLMALAELRGQRNRYDEAESFYREVIKNHSDNPVAMNNLAVLLALRGIKLDEALELVNKAIEIAGPLGAMLDSRASVYMALDEPEKAVDDITAAVNDSETPVRLFHQAQAYKRAGRLEDAKIAWEKALEKGLTSDMLQPLEVPLFEEMKKTMEQTPVDQAVTDNNL